MARIRISIPAAQFEFEATGPEEQIGKWCDEAMKMRFGRDVALSAADRAVDRAWESNNKEVT